LRGAREHVEIGVGGIFVVLREKFGDTDGVEVGVEDAQPRDVQRVGGGGIDGAGGDGIFDEVSLSNQKELKELADLYVDEGESLATLIEGLEC